MTLSMLRTSVVSIVASIFVVAPAQKKYDQGVTDTEIKIGNIMPYSGPFSEYGASGRAQTAYFQMVNDRGGVNGRKINFITVDSGADVQKTVDLAFRLVEQDKVFLIVGSFGTLHNLTIRGYMNDRKIPQLFVGSAAETFNDSSHFPWTMGFQATFRTEALAYAKYVLQIKPDAKIAVLHANDEVGNEYIGGLRAGLGNKASAMIVKEASFKYSDAAAIDSQIAALKESGADVFMNLTFGKFATQAIRTAYDIGWRPLQFLPNGSLSIAAFIEPVRAEKSIGIISNTRSKEWSSAEAQRDPAVRAFLEWMKTYNTKGNERDAGYVYGYEVAQTLVEVLRKCGDDLTRANVMRQASHLDLDLGMLRPGIRITTSPTDYRPIKELFLVKFNGREWVSLGGVTGR